MTADVALAQLTEQVERKRHELAEAEGRIDHLQAAVSERDSLIVQMEAVIHAGGYLCPACEARP